MMLGGPLDGYMKTRLDGLSYRNGGLLDVLEFVLRGGAAKYGNNITHVANADIKQLSILADTFTVNAGITLTGATLRPVVIIADTFNISGTITTSGKGCSAAADGKRYTGVDYPFFSIAKEETSHLRNFCLCGCGGGSPAPSAAKGGGAYKEAIEGTGPSCDLTAAELEELILSPFFNIHQMGFGGSGASANTGNGAGPILLIGRVINLLATASLLANGIAATSGNYGGGGAGCIGLAGDTLSVHGSATLSASGGAKSGTGYDGGDGAIAQIEV